MIKGKRGVLTMNIFFAIAMLLLANCKKDEPAPDTPEPPVPPVVVNKDSADAIDSTSHFTPVKVAKTQTAKVYVHLMPWFESPKTSGNNQWGQHWTMANKNPNKIVEEKTGKREIASHFYPLTGPYASSDPLIIEYQTLLMKYSGIDGVLIDWYGTMDKNDYPANLKNTNAFTSKLKKAGLQYALVYEDAVLKNGFTTDDKRIDAAKADMRYLKTNDFSAPEYIHVDGKPLLLTFGPQTFQTDSSWTSIFSIFPNVKPAFLTLWYESGEAGSNAAGEYSWVYQDGNSHFTHLDNFYSRTLNFKIGSAYPGFKDFYTQGGWSDNVPFTIDYNDSITFRQTLQKAVDHVNYVQLITWNDYGEGTMIEPTQEFQYKFLTTLQDVLGVPYDIHELVLIHKLYQLRLAKFGVAEDQKKLDQAANYLAILQVDEAKKILDSF